mmetsp:Transcript_15659/g.43911  ORF Transcript_15659/g.43911 Transcript_15659/m.43911 type:complete len:263 (+) Transcript_15659:179-967(+)
MQHGQNRNFEYVHAHVRDHVRDEEDQCQRPSVAVQIHFHGFHKDEVCEPRRHRADEKLSDNQHSGRHVRHSANACCIPKNQEECLAGRFAKRSPKDGRLDVRVLVDELQAFFDAHETALAAAQNAVGAGVIRLGDLLLYLCEDGTNHLDDGDDQGTVGACSEMEQQSQRQAAQYRQTGNRRLVHSEVPFADRHGHDHITERNDESRCPKHAEQKVPTGLVDEVIELVHTHGNVRADQVQIWRGDVTQRRKIHSVHRPNHPKD